MQTRPWFWAVDDVAAARLTPAAEPGADAGAGAAAGVGMEDELRDDAL